MIDPKDHQTSYMVLAAVRHCLERRSYAPGLCSEWLRAHWRSFPAADREQIVREIRSALDGPLAAGLHLPDDVRPIWLSFLAFAQQAADSREKYRDALRRTLGHGAPGASEGDLGARS